MGGRLAVRRRLCINYRSMKRISPTLENHILTQMLLGYSYSEIAQSTGVALSTVKKIKARNKARYTDNKQDLDDWTAETAKSALQQTYRLLENILTDVESGTRSLSVKELILISNQMAIHQQLAASSAPERSSKIEQRNLNALLSKLKK